MVSALMSDKDVPLIAQIEDECSLLVVAACRWSPSDQQRLLACLSELRGAEDEKLLAAASTSSDYHCAYEIDINASSAEEAALEAERIRTDPTALPGVWSVRKCVAGVPIGPAEVIDTELLAEESDGDV